MTDEVAIRNWGNSQGIRLPKHIMEQMKLKTSAVLRIRVEKDSIVLKKTFHHKSCEERLAEYDGKLTVADFDYGEPVGKEIL